MYILNVSFSLCLGILYLKLNSIYLNAKVVICFIFWKNISICYLKEFF